jgi:hypothetical protein
VQGDFHFFKGCIGLDGLRRGVLYFIVTCDHKKEKGGELLEVERARKHNWLSPEERKKQAHLQPASSF